MRGLSVFHSAAQALIRHQRALEDKSADEDFAQVQFERTLPKDDWIKAVINGADDHSPRWRHLLVLGGLLLGFGPVEDYGLSSSMRNTLESALVTAVNLSLDETAEDDELGLLSITLVLNHCFPYLADHERAEIDYDALLPVLMRSTLHSDDGLQSGYFLGTIDLDIRPVSNKQFRWPERSSSFQQVVTMASSPLLSSLGPLSRLIGHSIEHAKQSWLVASAIDDLESFAKTLHMQWRHNKLSEVDVSEEILYLDRETLEKTMPQLWKLLKSTLYAAVIILRSAVGRMLGDSALANDEGKPGQGRFLAGVPQEANSDCSGAQLKHQGFADVTKSILHIYQERVFLIFAIQLRLSDRNGHSDSLPDPGRIFLVCHKTGRNIDHTTASP